MTETVVTTVSSQMTTNHRSILQILSCMVGLFTGGFVLLALMLADAPADNVV